MGTMLTTTRRVLLGATLAVAAVPARASASSQSDTKVTDFLFVQTADSMTFDPSTMAMSLNRVSPLTLFFSDRPDRIAGNMKTAAFIPFWSEGTNSFLSDPPNADVSILDGDTLQESVVTLKDPRLGGENLIYTVEIVEGELPAEGQNVSLFIDIIGMPLTPLSFAGVRRRMWRRAVWR